MLENKDEISRQRVHLITLPQRQVGTFLLVSLTNARALSFSNVITFNMDEYVGLPAGHPQSYGVFMQENLFQHIDIPSSNTHLLNGNAADLNAECQRYESCISAAGGIHLFLGGVGPDGHIAFNEPASSLNSRTRLKFLTLSTRQANARFFNDDIHQVPKQALTVGVGTIMNAEEVMILATGTNKSRAVKAAIEDSISHMWTISVRASEDFLLQCVQNSGASERSGQGWLIHRRPTVF
jgi:glucosamine-6-phosphate deaminase